MRNSNCTGEQIGFALEQVETGTQISSRGTTLPAEEISV